MANKETTYTVKIDAEIADLAGKVTSAKNALDSLLKSGNAPKGLTSALERVEAILGRIQDSAKMPPSKQMFSSLEKDVGKAGLAFGDLIRHIEALGDMGDEIKLELFSPEEQAKIQAAIQGLNEYGKALAEIAAKEKEVEKARKASEAAQGKAKSARDTKAAAKTKLDKKVARKEGKQAEIATLDPEKDATKIAKLNTEIAELEVEIKELTRDFNQAKVALTEANKAAEQAKTGFEAVNGELNRLKTDKLAQMRDAANRAGVAIDAIDGEDAVDTMGRLGTAMAEFKDDALNGLPERVEATNDALKESSVVVNSATDSIRGAARAWDEYNEQQSKVQDVQKRIKDFLGYAGAAKILSASLKQAFEATKELDAAMTEIAVVTDFNISDMWDQLPEYTDRANDLGISITSAYEASALFYQQGLKTNEVIELSNETLKMAKIAGLDAADATDRMTAALRGFNMELDAASAQKISDVYSELAAITASDVDEISTAMTKTASIASSAGMEFETTAAFLSQIIETTRESAETAGTAMKTVIARFQELKKAPDEIGQVDGEIVDANAIEGALRSVGVSLRDSSGQFRELDDVFLELSSKWDSLDKNTQRYIATIAAGSRQQSRFIAMMQDYGRTQELVAAANNSSGASARQYEKTLDSLETKLTQLDNAWTEFSTSLVNSDFIKAGVDLLTAFVTAMNKATNAFDGWMGSVSKIGMILALFNVAKAAFNKFGQKLLNFFSNTGIQMGKNIADGVVAGLKEGSPAIVQAAEEAAGAAESVTRPKGSNDGGPSDSSESSTGKKVPWDMTEKSSAKGSIKTAGANLAKKGILGTVATKLPLGQMASGAKDMFKADADYADNRKKAKIAGAFVQNGGGQIVQANQAMTTAGAGADMATMLGTDKLGQSINALALPLDSIEKQFKEKMTAMGYFVDEVEAEWKQLYETISTGEVTAEQAVGAINNSLNTAASFSEMEAQKNGISAEFDQEQRSLQVTDHMVASSGNKVAALTGSPINMGGLDVLSETDNGDMQNSLNFSGNPLVEDMQAMELPLQQIETQYKEKMAAMGVATDAVDKEWQELLATITKSGTTANQALSEINQSLENTAKKAEQGGKVVSGDNRRIKNTGATKAEAASKKQQKYLAKEKEMVEELQETKDQAAESEQKNGEKAQKSADKQLQGYQKVSAGLTKTGTALTMVGAGFTSVGTMFENAGMTEAAEVFNGMGTAIGTVGTVMTTLGSIMSFITPIMGLLTGTSTASAAASTANAGAKTAEAGANTAMGVSAIFAQMACWPLGLVLLVILAVIISLVIIIFALVAAFKAMAAASPAGQLKAAEEAAAAAAETADQAAEAYSNLVSALEELDGKYDALEELTKGTKEWNDAVRDINKSVLDLIEEYPELAQFAENKNGVLTIDMESEGVQGVMKEYEASMVSTQNAAMQANLKVLEKQADLTFSELDKGSYIKGQASAGDVLKGAAIGAGIGTATSGAFIGTLVGGIIGGVNAAKDSAKEDGRDETEALAKALASGDIVDTGEGYSTDLTDEEMQAKYGISTAQLQDFYSQVGNATDDLRKFGDQLNKNESIMDATYEAMATNAESLANTAGWAEEEITQGQQLIDADVYKTISDQNKDAWGDMDVSSKNAYDNMDANQKGYFDDAIKDIYGEDATVDGKKVTFVNADGETVTEKLSERKDQIRNLMIEKKTTDDVKAAMEGTKTAISKLNSELGNGLGSKLYSGDSGGKLTEADIRNSGLVDSNGNMDANKVKELWNSLGAEGKNAYGGDTDAAYQAFYEDMEAFKTAQGVFDEAREDLGKYISDAAAIDTILASSNTDFAKGLTQQFETIAEKLTLQAKTEGDINQIIGDLGVQLGNIKTQVPEHLREQFESQFAGLDLSDADALLGFQLDLINLYGIEKGQAEALVSSLQEATMATSAWTVRLTTYNELTGAQQELNKTLEEGTRLSWEYQKALNDVANGTEGAMKNIKDVMEKQIANFGDSVTAYQGVYAAAQNNMATLYASGATRDANPNADYRKYASVSNDGVVTIDWEEVSKAEIAGDIDMETFSEWAEDLQDTAESMTEAEEGAKEQLEALKELEDQTKQSYMELRDLAKEAVLHKLEEQIELQEETLDATKEAADQLTNKLQEYINNERQLAENEKTEQALEDQLNKQAYLSMDTSNANLLALQQEQKAFEENAEAYRNTLIDQSIQALQDANEKAFEQRERQISIAERQLELYENSTQFQNEVDALMEDALAQDDIRNSQLYEMLDFQRTGMSTEEEKWYNDELNALGAESSIFKNTDWIAATTNIQDTIDNIGGLVDIMVSASAKKTANQQNKLSSEGFQVQDATTFQSGTGTYTTTDANGNTSSKSYATYEEYLNAFDSFANKNSESQRVEADSRYKEISGSGVEGINAMSRSEYFKEYSDEIASGANVMSYEEYIEGKYNDTFDDYGLTKNDGQFLVHFSDWNGFKAVTDADSDLNMYVPDTQGTESGAFTYQVGLGPEISDETTIAALDKIIEEGYGTADTRAGAAKGILYKGKAYIKHGGKYRALVGEKDYSQTSTNYMDYTKDTHTPDAVKEKIRTQAKAGNNRNKGTRKQYKTGGLADFTGPAWLDGTPEKPEYILNAKQTERFFSLIDVLENFDSNEAGRGTSGDNYFDIKIEVEKLENDYDVEQIANKIRNMIYEDATYRNVNAINHIR